MRKPKPQMTKQETPCLTLVRNDSIGTREFVVRKNENKTSELARVMEQFADALDQEIKILLKL